MISLVSRSWTPVRVVAAVAPVPRSTNAMEEGPILFFQYQLQGLILFKMNGKDGYLRKDALKKRYIDLDGRDKRVLVDFKYIPYWGRGASNLTGTGWVAVLSLVRSVFVREVDKAGRRKGWVLMGPTDPNVSSEEEP